MQAPARVRRRELAALDLVDAPAEDPARIAGLTLAQARARRQPATQTLQLASCVGKRARSADQLRSKEQASDQPYEGTHDPIASHAMPANSAESLATSIILVEICAKLFGT